MSATDTYNQQQGKATPAPMQSNDLIKREPFQATIEQMHQAYASSRLACYELDLDKEFKAPDAVLSIGGSCIASRGNISTVVGEAKSKKTFLTSGLVASLLQWGRGRSRPFPMMRSDKIFTGGVIWFDTEQSEFHARKVADRIARMSGFLPTGKYTHDPRIYFFTLRELDPKDRLAMLLESLEHFAPTLVVIDGVADLQRNTNDLEESDRLVNLLMSLSTLHDCHILSILHTNPGSDKARGHLGSSLQRKSETVLYVHKVGEKSLVEPQFCRNEPFDRFAFRVNEEGIPELCDLPEEPSQPSGEVERILRDYYGGAVERTVLIGRVAELSGLGRDAAAMRVRRAEQRGVLIRDGKVVRLATTEATTEATPPEPTVTPEPIPEEEETPF